MGLGNVFKVKAQTVLGMDTSTNSIAFALMDGETPIYCGEIFLQGDTPHKRMRDAKEKVRKLIQAGYLRADYVAVEATIMVRNIETAITLAEMNGAIISELMAFNPEVHKIAPISWQSGIGVPNLKKHEKEALKAANPGRKPSWYQNEGRKIRKARILEVARKYFDIPTGSDNVGDACGLAVHVARTLTRRG